MQQEQQVVCFICMDSEGSTQIYWHRDANGNKCAYKHPICNSCLDNLGGRCPICRTEFQERRLRDDVMQILQLQYETWDTLLSKAYPLYTKGLRYVHNYSSGPGHGYVPVELYNAIQPPLIINYSDSCVNNILSWLLIYGEQIDPASVQISRCGQITNGCQFKRMRQSDLQRLLSIFEQTRTDIAQLKHILLNLLIRYLQTPQFIFDAKIPLSVGCIFESADSFRNAQINEVFKNNATSVGFVCNITDIV